MAQYRRTFEKVEVCVDVSERNAIFLLHPYQMPVVLGKELLSMADCNPMNQVLSQLCDPLESNRYFLVFIPSGWPITAQNTFTDSGTYLVITNSGDFQRLLFS